MRENGSSQNSTKVWFDKGPKVSLEITMKDGKIQSSHLSLSSQFTCTGAAPYLLEWLHLYIEGKAPPLPLSYGSPFQSKVMKALSEIPFGETITYKELANRCGKPNGARAAGNACGKNPFILLIPCHRVIHSDGTIGGFAAGTEIKRRLLEFEAG